MQHRMNPEVKQQWVSALRSGKYKQCKSMLRCGDDKFCVLGVLADVVNHSGWNHKGMFWYHNNFSAVLSESVMREAGFEYKEHDSGLFNYHAVPRLTIGTETEFVDILNDRDYTFEELANAIEGQL